MHKIPPYPTYPEDNSFDYDLLYEIISNIFVVIACCMAGVSVIAAIFALFN